MNAISPTLQVTINGHQLPLCHAQVVRIAMQQFHEKVAIRHACGESEAGEALRTKWLTAAGQINTLFIPAEQNIPLFIQ